MKLTKLEVALRHVETAIDLFSNEKDPVSTYSLAMTAFNVLQELSAHLGPSETLEAATAWVKPEMEKQLWLEFRRPWNYMKHADRDPGGELEDFRPAVNEMLLMFCAILLIERGYDKHKGLQAYVAWATLMHPEYIKKPASKEARSLLDNVVDFTRKMNLTRAESLEILRDNLRAAASVRARARNGFDERL